MGDASRIKGELSQALANKASLEEALKKACATRDDTAKALAESKSKALAGEQLSAKLAAELKASQEEVHRSSEILKATTQSLAAAKAEAATKIAALETSLKNSADALHRKEDELKKLLAQSAADTAAHNQLAAELKLAQESVAKHLAQLKACENSHAMLDAEFKNARAQLERYLAEAKAALAARDKQIRELESSYTELKVTFARENGAAGELRTQAAAMLGQIKVLVQARDQALIDLGSARESKIAEAKRSAEFRNQLAELQDRIKATQASMAKVESERHSWRDEIAQRDEKLAAAMGTSAALQARLAALEVAKQAESDAQRIAETGATKLAAELVAAKSERDAAEAAGRQLLNQIASEEEAGQAELAQLRAEFDALKAERRRRSIDPILL